MKSLSWFRPIHFRFLLLTLFQGMASAAVLPILSTHLSLDLHIQPIFIGIFFAINTVAGIAISTWFAHHSDHHMKRTSILRVAVLSTIIGVIGIGQTSNYAVLIVMGILWSGMSATILPQLFAGSRETVNSERMVLLQSLMRAAFAFSWVITPPLAFLLLPVLGFQTMMWLAAGVFGVMFILIPDTGPIKHHSRSSTPDTRILTPHILAIFAVFMIINMANSTYIVYMPLYLLNDLKMPTFIPGLLMGLAAAIEMPLMIAMGALSHRWRLLAPVQVAVVAGILFYFGMTLSDRLSMFLILQLLNATLIGLSAGLGTSIFQSLLPNRPGMAATLLGNAFKTGSLAGATIGALIAQFGQYRGVFLFSTLGLCLALFLVCWADRQIRVINKLT
ncbi:sugar efflux transporter [Gynuella sunshinyii]|uniref:Arabinose efflux permease n=1 Tax=Gynuella sunshinyii YC6258 TaxID=1445510 RepID=A0A0C5VQ17_9GAMM|nr:sugar efflux transporter [Gynuella sunshinyii]AJQ92374.1 arabinose efflux permease [Gynuella sunshinyii YC6258]